jgi:hypothetical protein
MPVLVHVGVLSVAKISALFGLILGLAWGILLSLFAIASVSVMDGMQGAGGPGAWAGILVILLAALLGAIGGFISGALTAFLYNVFAGWVGGIDLDLI